MPVTMTDIAKKCGVSQPVVSAVLNNNYSNCRVSEAKKQKILKTAHQLHFTPNALARSMVTRKTHTVNVIIPSAQFFQSFNYSTIVTGLQEAAGKHGYRLKFSSLSYGYSDFRALGGTMADANIVFYWGGPRHNALVREVEKLDLPFVVAYGKCNLPKAHNLYFDSFSAMYEMAGYLVGKGHRRIAYVQAFAGDVFHREGSRGIQRAVSEHPGVVLERHPLEVPRASEEKPDGLFAIGRQFMRRALQEASLPSAFMFNQDAIALGALKQAQDAGRRIPADLAITGSNYESYTDMFEPRLTTVDLAPFRYGEKLFERLFHLIAKDVLPPVKEAFPLRPLYRETA